MAVLLCVYTLYIHIFCLFHVAKQHALCLFLQSLQLSNRCKCTSILGSDVALKNWAQAWTVKIKVMLLSRLIILQQHQWDVLMQHPTPQPSMH